MIQGLPPGSVETFTDTIQPMLLNHCSTAGCHGPQGSRIAAAAARIVRQKHQPAGNPAEPLCGSLGDRSESSRRQPPVVGADTRSRAGQKRRLHHARGAAIPTALGMGLRGLESAGPRRRAGVAGRAAPVAVGRPAARGSTGQTGRQSTGRATGRAGHGPHRLSASGQSGTGRTKDEPADMNPADATSVKTPAEKSPAGKPQPAAESDPFDPQAFNDRYLKARRVTGERARFAGLAASVLFQRNFASRQRIEKGHVARQQAGQLPQHFGGVPAETCHLGRIRR